MPEEADAVGSGDIPSDGTTSDQGDSLGADLFGDDAPQSEPAPSANGTSADFDPNAVDIRRTKLEEIPEAHRQYFEPAYKALKDLESGFTKRDQDLQAAQAAAQTQEQEWRDRLQSLAQPPQPTEAEQLEQRLSDTNLTHEQREGVDVVRNIVRSETAPMQEALSRISGIEAIVQQWQQQTQAQQQEALATDIADARGEYGEDVENYGQQIAALIDIVNPATRQNYTVRQAYELVTGKAQQVADNARSTDKQVRARQKNQITSPTGTPVVGHDGESNLSTAETRAELEALGFER